MTAPHNDDLHALAIRLVRFLLLAGREDPGCTNSHLQQSADALDAWATERFPHFPAGERADGAYFLERLFECLPRTRAAVRFAAKHLFGAARRIARVATDPEVGVRLGTREGSLALLATYVASGMVVSPAAASDVLASLSISAERTHLIDDLVALAQRQRRAPRRPLSTLGRVSLPPVLRCDAPAHDGWLQLAETLRHAELARGRTLADIPPTREHLQVACVLSPTFFALIFERRNAGEPALRKALAELSGSDELLHPGERRALRTIRARLEEAAEQAALRRRGILYRLHLDAGLSASQPELAKHMGRSIGDVALALDNSGAPTS